MKGRVGGSVFSVRLLRRARACGIFSPLLAKILHRPKGRPLWLTGVRGFGSAAAAGA